MALDRNKLIAEIYGLAALVETFTPEEQAETPKEVAETLADAEHYRYLVRKIYRGRKEYAVHC
jgi:1,2-phenylacetyl-CoA epoxidase PaaB subunit